MDFFFNAQHSKMGLLLERDGKQDPSLAMQRTLRTNLQAALFQNQSADSCTLVECTELYFQMYNVSVRCKKGNLLASCHLAHCTAIVFPHIMITAIFCMYVHWHNLPMSSTTLGIKRGNILLSNSYPRFPSSITLSEIRLISRNTFRNASDGLQILSSSCFCLSCLCRFATYPPHWEVIPARRQAFTTEPDQNIADTESFQYFCSSHKIISTQMKTGQLENSLKGVMLTIISQHKLFLRIQAHHRDHLL